MKQQIKERNFAERKLGHEARHVPSRSLGADPVTTFECVSFVVALIQHVSSLAFSSVADLRKKKHTQTKK